jgi:hypothetical protein
MDVPFIVDSSVDSLDFVTSYCVTVFCTYSPYFVAHMYEGFSSIIYIELRGRNNCNFEYFFHLVWRTIFSAVCFTLFIILYVDFCWLLIYTSIMYVM